MARAYNLPQARSELLMRRTSKEKIVGTDERNRRTKTWIPDLKMGFSLSALRNYADRLEERLNKQAGLKQGERSWSSVELYRNLHQEILETMASYKGFAIRQITKQTGTRDDFEDEELDQSSVETDNRGQRERTQ